MPLDSVVLVVHQVVAPVEAPVPVHTALDPKPHGMDQDPVDMVLPR